MTRVVCLVGLFTSTRCIGRPPGHTYSLLCFRKRKERVQPRGSDPARTFVLSCRWFLEDSGAHLVSQHCVTGPNL
ncbi:hypothetical protein DFH94DRAFT_701900 [Russula ochroleuca]|uniref:Uncharacterized protein n=1 Tax=Russula ochroleuca TaxID=152965 RepID=A0A9P5N5G2_9AGAM|nr:hypothetical protein DFH94DRAFT_701900 [Russula ochroleuca]